MNREILTKKMVLRKATAEDSESIFLWRNAPETRKNSFNSCIITWEDHQKWFSDTLQRTDRLMLIGEITNNPIGVLRYDIEQNTAEISIYLVPGLYGNGLGTTLLRTGTDWLCMNFPNITRMIATVLPENIPSQKIFERTGYKECYRVYEYDTRSQK